MCVRQLDIGSSSDYVSPPACLSKRTPVHEREDLPKPLLVSEPNQGVWVMRPVTVIVGVDRVSAMRHRASGWPCSSQETARGPAEPEGRGRVPTSTQVDVPGVRRYTPVTA